MKFRVIRQHFGDKQYMPGDEREAPKADVQHLIDNGVLAEISEPKAKKEPEPKNKAVKAPRNKAQ